MYFEKIKNYFIKPKEDVKKDKLEELLNYAYYEKLIPVLEFCFDSPLEKIEIKSENGNLFFCYENIKKNDKEIQGCGNRAYADFDVALLFYKLLNGYSSFLEIKDDEKPENYEEPIKALKVIIIHALYKYYQDQKPEVIRADLYTVLEDVDNMELTQFIYKYKKQLMERVNENYINCKQYTKFRAYVAPDLEIRRINSIIERNSEEESEIKLTIKLQNLEETQCNKEQDGIEKNEEINTL